MSSGIDDYLEQLKKELSGSDPATVQDAVSDAEEHLRTGLDQARKGQPELPENDALQKILAAYGTPSEIAAAYREIETRVTPSLAPPKQPDDRSLAYRFFGVFVDPRAYASLFYMFFSLITGIVYFTWAMTGIWLSVGLIFLVIGLPFVALFLLSIQGIALVEGRIVEALLGVRMPRRPLFSKKHLGIWVRFKALVSDKLSWTTIVYMIVQLPLGIFYFTLFVTMLALGLVGIAQPILYFWFDLPLFTFDGVDYYPEVWMLPFIVIVGALWILLTMHLAKFFGRLHGIFAKSLLVRN